MAIQLDPFHMLRGINCPEPVTDVVLEGWGQVLVTGLSSENLCFTCAPPPLTCVFKTGYFATQFSVKTLSAPFITCEQFDLTITGQSSGASLYLGGGPQKADFGLSLDNCIFDSCYYQLDDGSWRRCFANSNFNPVITFTAYLPDPHDLTHAEVVDLSFPAPPVKAITSITEKDASTIYVNCVNHQLRIFSYMTISGTSLYDGNWTLDTVESADQFTISTPYVGDDSGGTVVANYAKNF